MSIEEYFLIKILIDYILEVGDCNGGIPSDILNSIKDAKESIIFFRFRNNKTSVK